MSLIKFQDKIPCQKNACPGMRIDKHFVGRHSENGQGEPKLEWMKC